MKKRKYNEFMKRYDKFKKNNLPTPFWDDERKTLEYVNIGNRKTIYDFDNAKNKMEVYNYLTEALENIANVEINYNYIKEEKYSLQEIIAFDDKTNVEGIIDVIICFFVINMIIFLCIRYVVVILSILISPFSFLMLL